MLVTYLTPSSPDFSFTLIPRYILGTIIIAFVSGYCLVNILFLGKNKLDFVEQLVLSVALSFGLIGLDGLFLGLTPIGLTFKSIIVSLSVMVLALALIALVRKSKESGKLDVQSSEQVSA